MILSLLADPSILLALLLIGAAATICAFGPFPWRMNTRGSHAVEPRRSPEVARRLERAGGEAILIGSDEAHMVAPSEAVLVRSRPTELPILIGPERAVMVKPPRRGAWDTKGWQPRTENGARIYTGHYRVVERRTRTPREFAGLIEQRGREVRAFVADPPREIRSHPKGPCFQPYQGGPWFRIHWITPPDNVDDALLYVERVFDEALNGRA